MTDVRTRVTPGTSDPPAADDGQGIRGVARGGLANLAGAGFAGLSGFAVAWIVTHALTTDEAGAFFASTAAFVLIGTVAKLGTQTSLVYFPARLRAIGNAGALRRCLQIGLVPVAVFSIGIAVAMWVLAAPIASIAAHNGAAEYAHQLRILAFFLPIAALSDAILAGTRGWRAMRPTVLCDRIVRPGMQVGLLAGMLAAHLDVPAAFLIAWSGPYVVSAALGWRSLRELLRVSEAGELVPVAEYMTASGSVYRASTSRVDVAESGFSAIAFWRFTGPRAFASIAQLALQRVDVLLLASIAGLKAAAIYAVAGRFVVLGQFANQGISQAVQPRLAEHLATDDRRNANLLYQIATAWLIVVAWPIYLLVAVFAATYLQIFGSGYATGRSVVWVLALAMTIGSGCGMVDMVLAMAGRTSWNLLNVSIALAVQMVIDIALIPHLGPLGAAIGLGVALLLNNLVPLLQIALTMGIHPFGRASASAAALSLGCFGAVPLGIALVAGTGDLAALAAVLTGSALYLVGLLVLRRVLQLDAFMQLRRTPRAAEKR
jgi:O-antigen/teichoic acid export membrane protein